MDQAKTLRQLLGKSHQVIHPILGDLGTDYAACVGRFVLEQHARQGHTTVLFDGSAQGLSQLLAGRKPHDLVQFFRGIRNLEDLAIELAEQQYFVPASHGLEVLAKAPEKAALLHSKLHRLPASCDRFYATLPYSATELAAALAPAAAWTWVVQPTAKSVTHVFQAIRSSKGVDENAEHRVIVAGVKSTDEADHVFANLLETTSRFLDQPIHYGGHLPKLVERMGFAQVGGELITAGRRIAKAICSSDEHAWA